MSEGSYQAMMFSQSGWPLGTLGICGYKGIRGSCIQGRGKPLRNCDKERVSCVRCHMTRNLAVGVTFLGTL